MVEGSGTVLIAATNSYEGGTYIRNGTLTMYEPSCLPTNGTVWLSAGATLNGYNSDRNHQFASLVGAGTVIESAFTLTRSLEPGDNGPGTLSFTSAAKLALGPACTTIFELDALTGVNDRVNMLHLGSNLTLGGTLRVVNLGGLEAGSYKLFDMIGSGRVSGEFQRIEMPRASTGTVEVNAAGDVMLHVIRQFGTLFCIR